MAGPRVADGAGSGGGERVPLSAVDPDSIGGYQLLERLGSGGMGVVYLARSASGGRVAVKVVHAQFAQNEEFRTRFRQEVAAVRRVSGAFTASVVDADPDAALPWMATLYVPAATLSDRVDKRGPLTAAEVLRLARGLVEALGDIHHADVVHRDLKPANVLMAQDGPRVIDFGISRAVDHESLTFTGHIMGTPPFMSPEALSRPREVTAASDIFSLGALLVYAATGQGPFDAESPYLTMYQVVHEPPALDRVAPALRGIVERCLEKDPADRPGLEELARMLDELPANGLPADVQGPAARPSSRWLRPLRGRSSRTLAAVATAVALAAGTLVLADTVDTGSPVDDRPPAASTGSVSRPAPVREAPLPAGWRPWELTGSGSDGETDAVTDCRAYELAVYCNGDGFHAARIDAASGHVDWRVPSTEPGSSSGVDVRAGRVLLRGPASPDGSQREDLMVLDAKTGRNLWKRRAVFTGAVTFFGRAVLSSDGMEEGSLVGRDARTGAELWSTPWPGTGLVCDPMVFADAPYAACSGTPEEGTTFLRLDPENGTPKKIIHVKGVTTAIGVDGGDLLILSSEAKDTPENWFRFLLRVDIGTGHRRTLKLPEHPVSAATLAGGHLFFVQDTGRVTAIDVTTGQQVWSEDTAVDLLGTPIVSGREGAVYLSSYSGRLVALDLRTGRKRWQTAAMGASAWGTTGGVLSIRAGGSLVTRANGSLRSIDPLHPNA
ncbi:protein kinase domain-containing protein [Streptomyces sp. AK02-01A]|uniref:serine/threonine-protein kinase n=1 Tax=Streptomyces sp. AK02-01A TaxID=3028648 RepID=UPI0029B3B52F|nr:PQQ-binding-like beta-propeller repeat protein [Streptomyces sp. AK02-01A]MDX3851839.1 PQQ-binding-like beta-propeller repeat protein [Streptomyces sp. AK02-01A]